MGTYRFTSTWVVQAPREDVWTLLCDALTYPRWWPDIERVQARDHGSPDGGGQRVRVTMRSRLPYRLCFDVVRRQLRKPDLIVLDAFGDLAGSGRWELHEHGEVTTATYTWQVATTKTWMNLLSPFARPAFVWNHHASMRRGADGLARHLGVTVLDARSHPRVRVRDWAPLGGLCAALLALAGAGRRRLRRG